MTTRKIRTYDKEFKLNAVKLHVEQGRTSKQVSEELGIPHATLIGWVNSALSEGKEAFPGKGY